MIGIDFSMNSPAVVIGDSKDPHKLMMLCFKQRKSDQSNVKNIIIETFKEYPTNEERYYNNALIILEFIEEHSKSKEVWIEDYSYGSSGTVFNIAEATGILKHLLWINGYTINKVSPKSVKKFATQSGNSNKTDMYDSFMKEYNFNFNDKLSGPTKDLRTGYKDIPSPVSDIIDAYFILMYGLNQDQ